MLQSRVKAVGESNQNRAEEHVKKWTGFVQRLK